MYFFLGLQSPSDPLLPNDERGGTTTNTQYGSRKVKECGKKQCKEGMLVVESCATSKNTVVAKVEFRVWRCALQECVDTSLSHVWASAVGMPGPVLHVYLDFLPHWGYPTKLFCHICCYGFSYQHIHRGTSNISGHDFKRVNVLDYSDIFVATVLHIKADAFIYVLV